MHGFGSGIMETRSRLARSDHHTALSQPPYHKRRQPERCAGPQAASMAVQTHLAARAARAGVAPRGPSRSRRTARARTLDPNPTITVISTTLEVGRDVTTRRTRG